MVSCFLCKKEFDSNNGGGYKYLLVLDKNYTEFLNSIIGYSSVSYPL